MSKSKDKKVKFDHVQFGGRPTYPKDLFEAYVPPEGVVGYNERGEATVNDAVGLSQSLRNFNVTNDPMTTLFEEGVGFPGYAFLSQLSVRGEYRAIVETRAKEATREWIEIRALNSDEQSQERVEKIKSALVQFRVRSLLREAVCKEGYFGLCHLYIDMENAQQDPQEKETPLYLTPKKIAKGSLKGFRLIEPIWTTPVAYNTLDPMHPYFYKPSSWWINGQVVHATRLITLVSKEVSDLLKPAYNFGGVPFAFMCKPYVDNWLRTRQSVSDLIHTFSTMILKTDLSQLLSPGCEELSKRASLMAAYRDNQGLQIVDKDTEDMVNVSASLGGLDKLQAQSQEHMAAISETPLVKLLGITPSGLNASSDGEIRCYYDTILSFQEAVLREPLQHIISLIQLHLFGDIAEDIEFEFNPLWQLDAMDKAKIEQQKSQVRTAYYTSGVVSQTETRAAIQNDHSSLYPNVNFNTP